jgi:hypothetical protein
MKSLAKPESRQGIDRMERCFKNNMKEDLKVLSLCVLAALREA